MSPAAALTQTSPMIVAIVEDQAAIAELLYDVLEDAGYAPVITSSPVNAAAEIAEFEADIVLLDIMMPRKDGWEVLDELRAEPATRDVPVILMSAVCRDGYSEYYASVSLRAEAYFVKPFAMGAMLSRIRELL
ncbi:MAG TPA: response regulator, partial [Thermomicrobiales bacterium]|nr:response regulator [Thermomicrobiales bacterium]